MAPPQAAGGESAKGQTGTGAQGSDGRDAEWFGLLSRLVRAQCLTRWTVSQLVDAGAWGGLCSDGLRGLLFVLTLLLCLLHYPLPWLSVRPPGLLRSAATLLAGQTVKASAGRMKQ